MDLSWHALNSTLQTKTHYHTEKQGFGYSWLSKKSRHTYQNPLKLSPVLEKVSLLPAKLHMLFPAHLWVREFWPQMTGLLSKILACTKMGGA